MSETDPAQEDELCHHGWPPEYCGVCHEEQPPTHPERLTDSPGYDPMDGHAFRVTLSNGDTAYADDPDGAVVAARTMWDDVLGLTPGIRCSASFYDRAGRCLCTVDSRRELG